MKQFCEYLCGLRYTFRMMGITVNNPFFTYRDIHSVLWNTSVPDSTLNKKSSAVAYYFIRSDVARKEWITGYIKTSDHCLGLITKTVSSGQDRKRIIEQLIYNIYPKDKVGSF